MERRDSDTPTAAAGRSLRAVLEIGRVLGPSRVIDDPDALQRFSGDGSEAKPCLPAAAVIPCSASEVSTAIAIASRHGAAITPRAGGTGKSGGAVPCPGGLVMACDHLRSIKEIHEGDLVAVVEPGVVLADLHREVEARGLFYPPDPASLDSCCLGGNVAEDAGGPRAFKYGVTSRYLLRLEAVMPGGEVLAFGHRPVKGVAGYGIASLLAGSEGTLGFFTEITLRLIPRPTQVSTALALFDGAPAAGRGIGAVLAAGIVPRVMEIMDRECIETVRAAGAPLPSGIGALVIMEFDGSEAAVEHDLERGGAAMTAAGAREIYVAAGAVERERLWKARRELSDSLKKRWTYKIAADIAEHTVRTKIWARSPGAGSSRSSGGSRRSAPGTGSRAPRTATRATATCT